MAAQKSTDHHLTSYKDTDLQRFWMPDAKAKECYECSLKFTTFRRRHHCRLCGQIFCSKCCAQLVPGRIIGCSGDLKVCGYCSKIVLSYLKSADIESDLQSDLQALQADLATKLSADGRGVGGECAAAADGSRNALGGGAQRRRTHSTNGTAHSDGSHLSADDEHSAASMLAERKVSLGYQEERLVAVQRPPFNAARSTAARRREALRQSQSLQSLHAQMAAALPYQHTGGAALVRYVLHSTQLAATEPQARAILSAMLEAGFLQCTSDAGQFGATVAAAATMATMSPTMPTTSSDDDRLDDDDDELMPPEFSDQHTYKLASVAATDAMTQSTSSSLFRLDVDVDASAVHLSRNASTTQLPTAIGEEQAADERGVEERAQHDFSFGFGTASSQEAADAHNAMLSTASGSKPLMEAFCAHEEQLLSE